MSKAQQFLGVTRTQMQTLISAGYLTHSVGGDHARPRFSTADIDRFLERHLCFPVKKEPPVPFQGYDIATAARKYGLSVATVYDAVLSGKILNITRATDLPFFLRYVSIQKRLTLFLVLKTAWIGALLEQFQRKLV